MGTKKLFSLAALVIIGLVCFSGIEAASQEKQPSADGVAPGMSRTAEGPALLLGKWNGKQRGSQYTEDTIVNYHFFFEKKGSKRVVGESNYKVPGWALFGGEIQKTTVKGNKVTFEVTYARNGSTAYYQLTLEGNRLTGWGKNYRSGNTFTVDIEQEAEPEKVKTETGEKK